MSFHSFYFFKLLIITSFIFSSDFNDYSESKKVKDVIVIQDESIDRSEKEAILILPGLGDSKKGRKAQKAFFGNTEFDLFIPKYVDRKSYKKSIENLEAFFNEKHLDEYKKIHVFSYIIGSWVLNSFIQEHGSLNISSIIYDRSPIQEQIPRLVTDKFPLIVRISVGKVIFDFKNKSYPSIPKSIINVGIIVESKATRLARMYKKSLKSYGEINWTDLDFNQNSDDIIYTWLNHDQMYNRFDIIGNDILHFIENGAFLEESRRVNYDWDPYKKYKE